MTSLRHDEAAQGTTTRDEHEVRAVIDGRSRAIEEQDADRLVGCYAPGVVVFDLAPPLQQPAAEVLDPDSHRAWFATFEPGIEYETRDVTITVGGDVALAHGLARLAATPRGSSEAFMLWFRMTLGLTRTGTTWLITHEHVSTPFHMDGSFRTAVDLEP
ncbi:MAG: nuclear transport factor 2 family protein [Blastococcus sp.]|nr:nuclear transport factor 2 family protein [Blastococcus sp.]